ncbi:hypothetical protein K469DRAFT_691995 [Zopfia rhizophila CBS 207.26]|uniref:Uncharacterized protein n=1 Tax=Zopfia rhizophila CBS 207.26 TaxID=1314779 RepID=A0A6A6DTL0_9PEZI|nr:hypothetical protein K469DRAFT_691995 [Zopfia rhizophila CBS 207.26]
MTVDLSLLTGSKGHKRARKLLTMNVQQGEEALIEFPLQWWRQELSSSCDYRGVATTEELAAQWGSEQPSQRPHTGHQWTISSSSEFDRIHHAKVTRTTVYLRLDALSLDAALRSFCHKFFDTSGHTACQQLSSFGMYGFSPQEEKMKYFWYEAMFKWMSSYRKEKLADIQANLAAVGNSGILASWVPSWRGGLLFALSLGLTWGATRMFGAPFAQGARLDAIETINGIMMSELIIVPWQASRKEKEGCHRADLARIQCREFVRIMEGIVRILNETPRRLVRSIEDENEGS